MARYLLIEFDDDDSAAVLKDKIDAQTAQGKPYRVAGVFARPRKFCECPPVQGYHANLVVTGAKFGWNTCTVCRKTKKGAHRPRNLLGITELNRMAHPIAGYEYRVDSIGIFEVPVKNIKE